MSAKKIVLLVGYTVGPGVGGVSRKLELEESLERIRTVVPADSKGRF